MISDIAREKARTEPLSSQLLWKTLDEENFNGGEVIQTLSRDPELQNLFNASAGVREGYSIEEHTRMVFDIFAEQYRLYSAHYQFRPYPGVRLFQTLKFAIALHDIGKPYAIEAGDKHRQHEFTVPVLDRTLVEFGFSERESHLVRALVGHDIIGEFIKGNIDGQAAKSQLVQVAATANLPLKDFVPLQLLFYTIDAASYPKLRQRIFALTKDGLLTPNHSQFETLWDIISKMESSIGDVGI